MLPIGNGPVGLFWKCQLGFFWMANEGNLLKENPSSNNGQHPRGRNRHNRTLDQLTYHLKTNSRICQLGFMFRSFAFSIPVQT
jgi:hypothetical protein